MSRRVLPLVILLLAAIPVHGQAPGILGLQDYVVLQDRETIVKEYPCGVRH